MDKQEENLKTYISYEDKKNKNSSYEPTIEEKNAIYMVTKDPSYSEILKGISGTKDYNTKLQLINEYILDKKLAELKDEKSLVSRIYGVNVGSIEELELNNGTKLFTFYDEKYGRKRLIENLGRESLVSQIKTAQNGNINFQTNDFQKNSDLILKDRAMQNSNRQELSIVEINEYIAHPENYGTIKQDTGQIIMLLSSIKDSKNIKYINVENNVLLTDKNEVFEITKDEEGNLKINEPKKWQNRVESVSNEDKVKDNTIEADINTGDEDIDNSIEENKMEDEPELISAKEIEEEIQLNGIPINIPVKEVIENIKIYYEHPEKMFDIENDIEKEFYEKMVNEVYAVRKASLEKKNKNVRKLTLYNPEISSYGFANLFFITILLLFLALVIFVF